MADSAAQLYDRMLVVRCQAGDVGAFEELVGRYQVRLAYFLRKLVFDATSLDDLLQDVWLDVFRGLPKLADPAAFPAWFYRVARDRAYRELRRRPRIPQPIEDVQLPAAEADEKTFSAEEVGLVHQCLDTLSEDHREVLVLRFLESMSYDDIAEVAGCSVGTVRSRLFYAKRALRAAIDAIERKRET